MDCFAVRIPPAGLNPTAIPVCCAYSRIARTMTRLTGSVAFVGSLPVEVLMKSAPAIMATKPVDFTYIYNWRVALASKPDDFVQQSQSTGARTESEGLTPGETYVFQCNAVGTAGTSDWSNAGSLMVI